MSENNFDTTEMSAAISSIGKPKPEQNFVGAPIDKEEAEAQARAQGWVKPKAYDYSLYGASKPGEEGDGADAVPDAELVPLPPWAHSAVKYEWIDEYGEVAPRVADLEATLFNEEFLSEVGEKLVTYENCDIKEAGQTHVNPVLKVRNLIPLL